jgi:hypothetical protein
MYPNSAQYPTGSGDRTVPSPPLVGGRILDGQALVLRPRLSRSVGVYGGLFVVFPIGVHFVIAVLLAVLTGEHWTFALPLIDSIVVIHLAVSLPLLPLMVGAGMAAGPVLAGNTGGVWIRTRRWPVTSVFLPWPAIARIYPRGTPIHTEICVVAQYPPAPDGAGAWARLDAGMQQMIFGRRLTSSTLCSGRRRADVLAELRQLSAGRTHIG